MIRSFAHKGASTVQATNPESRRSTPMSMHDPAHPGEILKELVIEPMGLSVSDAASHLGVSRKTLSKVLNGRGAITPEMALRLEMAFGKPNAAHWLRLQNAYDLWQIRHRSTGIHVTPVAAHAL
jgi:addiction module HigA family antidote